jgi:SAM-dependent methyltransferase
VLKGNQESNRQTRLPGLTVKDGWMEHPFDAANGVRTSGLVAGRHLKSGHPHDRHATAYYGVAPSVFAAMMRRWRRSRPAGAVEETTFVDVGAGMGRAMLLAAEMPFKRVVGVELNPALVRIARRNLAVWRKSGRALAPLRLIEGDATEFVWPQGPCVAFLFNPFGGAVMRRMLGTLAKQFAHRPRELDLIYVNNEQEGVVEMKRGFTRLFLGKVRRSREDAAADRKILNNQPDGEYASAPYEDCSLWRWGEAGNRK